MVNTRCENPKQNRKYIDWRFIKKPSKRPVLKIKQKWEKKVIDKLLNESRTKKQKQINKESKISREMFIIKIIIRR